MPSQGEKSLTQIHDAFAVQLKRMNGRAANRSEAKQQRIILAPRKMFMPYVLPRIVEWDRLSRYRIVRFDVVVFVIIATLARKR
jgi:hypothetical protein